MVMADYVIWNPVAFWINLFGWVAGGESRIPTMESAFMKKLLTVFLVATWAGMAFGQQPPALSESEELQRNLWMVQLLMKGDQSAQETLRDLDALLHDPGNLVLRRDLKPENMKFLVESANFAHRVFKGEPQLPLSQQFMKDYDLVFPKKPKLADAFESPLPKLMADASQDWAGDSTKEAAEKAIKKALEQHPKWLETLERGQKAVPLFNIMGPMVDQALGDQLAKTLAEVYRPNLWTLQNAGLTARLAKKTSPELTEVLGRLVASAKSDPLAHAVLLNVTGLHMVPNKPEAELRRDPQWANLFEVVDALKGPRTQKKQQVIRQFIEQSSKPKKSAMLPKSPTLPTPPAKAAEPAPSTSVEIDTRTTKEKLKDRVEEIRQVEHGVDMTLDIMAKLGADPKFVRDMRVLNKSGAQMAVGISMACANVWNPIGWITIAHSIMSVFSVGPTTDELILEKLALILKELREFRVETRRELARVRDDLRVNLETTLGRLEDLEYAAASHFGLVNGKFDGVHYRLYAAERRHEDMHRATLNRFAEAVGKSWATTSARLRLHPDYYGKLDGSNDSILKARFDDDLAMASVAADLAKSLTLSGGDGPNLAALAQADTWLDINDLLSLTGKRSKKVVNPEVWGESVDLLVQLAMSAPETFKSNIRLREELVKMLIAGEEFSDGVRLEPELLEPLMKRREANLKAALDELKSRTTRINSTVGLNPFKMGHHQVASQVPIPKYLGKELTVNERLEALGFPVDSAQLLMSEVELRGLIDRKVIPQAFLEAALLKPLTGRGGSQDYFGGNIEVAIVEIAPQIDEKSPYIKFRGQRRESTGFLSTGPGDYHPYYLYEGPLFVTAEIRYRTSRQAKPWIIRREKVPTQTLVRFLRENKPNGDPSRTFTYTPDGFKLALAICEGRGPVLLTLHTESGPGNNKTWEFNVVADPTWSPLGENRWFARAISHDSAVSAVKIPTGPITGRDVEKKLRFVGRTGWGSPKEFSGLPSVQYPLLGKEECTFVEFVAKQWAQVKADLFAKPTPEEPTAGILSANLVNEAVQRRLKYECQAFSDELAREEADASTTYGRSLRDEKQLIAIIMRLARLSGFNTKTQPLSASESAAAEQKDIPAEMEKLRLMILHAQRLHDSIRSQTPPKGPHAAVAVRLIRLTLTARSLDIDLIDELKRIGVTAPPHWLAAQQLAPTK
jgi:hypothetical protein